MVSNTIFTVPLNLLDDNTALRNTVDVLTRRLDELVNTHGKLPQREGDVFYQEVMRLLGSLRTTSATKKERILELNSNQRAQLRFLISLFSAGLVSLLGPDISDN